jgi:hypothetical protein
MANRHRSNRLNCREIGSPCTAVNAWTDSRDELLPAAGGRQGFFVTAAVVGKDF